MLFRSGFTKRGSGCGELLHGNNGRGLMTFAVVSLNLVAVLPSAVIASSPAVFAAASAVLVEEVSPVERRRMESLLLRVCCE